MAVIFLPLMKSEVKFRVRSLNFAQPVGKFTSDFIRGKKMCCHMPVDGGRGKWRVNLNDFAMGMGFMTDQILN